MGTQITQVIRILSASIAPVIVISGVGLLLLSMTNRYTRVLERVRQLARELDSDEEHRRRRFLEQVDITYRRARMLRSAIILGSFSIVFVAITVLSLFACQVIGAKSDYVSVPCFSLCLLALLGSLYFFIRDVTMSLTALELEIVVHQAPAKAEREGGDNLPKAR